MPPRQQGGFINGSLIINFVDTLEVLELQEINNRIVVTGLPAINQLNEKYSVTGYKKLFRGHDEPSLRNIFVFTLDPYFSIIDVAKEYCRNPYVEYAEPNQRVCLLAG